MNKKLIRLTESDLHRIVKESVKRAINEGNYFNHQADEFGRDYFEEAKGYAKGIVNYLSAMEDEGNSDSVESTDYLYRQLEERVIKFNQVFGLIKKLYIGNQKPMQPSIQP